MRSFLLVNPRSGSGDAEPLLEAAARRGISTHVLAAGDDSTAIALAVDADALGMAGGDGSLAGVAQVALERDLPFACVPLGTRNHFARDLGLDVSDPVATLDALVDGDERRVDVGYANDRLFLNNVSLGVYARLVHRREHRRRRRAALARLRALEIVATDRHPIELTLDGAPLSARVVLVANNEYALDVWSLGERKRLDAGNLYLYSSRGVLRMGWEERRGRRFTVDASSATVRAAIDGEPDELATPTEFSISPSALRVLVPRRPD